MSETGEQVGEQAGVLEVVSGSVSGFIGPLPEWEWRCPVCGSDPYDLTCHHPDCPTICDRAEYRHRCPQTDEAVAERFARIYGTVSLPTPPIPENWKVSERLNAYFGRRQPAAWAARDNSSLPGQATP